MAAGLVCSLFVPQMHLVFPGFTRLSTPEPAWWTAFSAWPLAPASFMASCGREKRFWAGKRWSCRPARRICFTETCVQLPGEELPYEDLFYRKSDAIELQAQRVELIDRCYADIAVRLTAERLEIGGDVFEPEKVLCLEVVADHLVLPREVMGPADVTFHGGDRSVFGLAGGIVFPWRSAPCSGPSWAGRRLFSRNKIGPAGFPMALTLRWGQ